MPGVDPQNRKPGTFPPGVSGNPGGRPKSKHITAAYVQVGMIPPDARKKYKPKTGWEEIALAQLDAAAGVGVEKPSTQAASEIADRVEGRAAAAQEDRDAVANAITADRLADLLDLAASRLNGK